MSHINIAKETYTAVVGSTSSAISVVDTGKTQLFRIVSDRNFHIRIDNGIAPSTVGDLFVPAGCVEIFRVDTGETISVIRAAGETDGTVWATKQI